MSTQIRLFGLLGLILVGHSPAQAQEWFDAAVETARLGVDPSAAETSELELVKPAWVVGDVPDTVWVLMETSVVTEDDDTMKEMLREAESHARDAVVDNETNVGRRFALAAVLGMRADREGGLTKIRAASSLYDELEVVLELDPDHAEARYMMGRLHAGIRRMGGVTRWLATNLLGGATLKSASWEEAERHLVFAESKAPEVPDHHLQLARVFLDTERPELAEAELEHVIAMTPTSPMEHAARAEALELQAEIARDR
jgi:hypothetical protein